MNSFGHIFLINKCNLQLEMLSIICIIRISYSREHYNPNVCLTWAFVHPLLFVKCSIAQLVYYLITPGFGEVVN